MESGKKSRTAVVTGASSGIGAVFARKLAAQGYHLVVVARREGLLNELREELESKHNIRVEVAPADLAEPDQLESLSQRVAEIPDLEMLVNNAGFGTMGTFTQIDAKRHRDMIQVHVVAAVQLTRTALPGMIERARGAIINVSSIAAWLHLAGNGQYSATKLYLNAFSESLQDELREAGVKVQALCPGFTYTGFHDTEELAGFDRNHIARGLWMQADDVVDYSLAALKRNRVIVIPGWKNRLLARVLRSPYLAPIVRRFGRYKVTESTDSAAAGDKQA